jgi:hypothetical protein
VLVCKGNEVVNRVLKKGVWLVTLRIRVNRTFDAIPLSKNDRGQEFETDLRSFRSFGEIEAMNEEGIVNQDLTVWDRFPQWRSPQSVIGPRLSSRKGGLVPRMR